MPFNVGRNYTPKPKKKAVKIPTDFLAGEPKPRGFDLGAGEVTVKINTPSRGDYAPLEIDRELCDLPFEPEALGTGPAVEPEPTEPEDELETEYSRLLKTKRGELENIVGGLMRTLEVIRVTVDDAESTADPQKLNKLRAFLDDEVVARAVLLYRDGGGSLPDEMIRLLADIYDVESSLVRGCDADDHTVADIIAIKKAKGMSSVERLLSAVKENQAMIRKVLPRNMLNEARRLRSKGVAYRSFFGGYSSVTAPEEIAHYTLGSQIERIKWGQEKASPILNDLNLRQTQLAEFLIKSMLPSDEVADILTRQANYGRSGLHLLHDLGEFRAKIRAQGLDETETRKLVEAYSQAYERDEKPDLDALISTMLEMDESSGTFSFIKSCSDSTFSYNHIMMGPAEVIKSEMAHPGWGGKIFNKQGSLTDILTAKGMSVIEAAMEAPMEETLENFTQVYRDIHVFSKRYGGGEMARPLVWIRLMEDNLELIRRIRPRVRPHNKEIPSYSEAFESAREEMCALLDEWFVLPFMSETNRENRETYSEILNAASASLSGLGEGLTYSEVVRGLLGELEGRLLNDIRELDSGLADASSKYQQRINHKIQRLKAGEQRRLEETEIADVKEEIEEELAPLLFPPIVRSLRSAHSDPVYREVLSAQASAEEDSRSKFRFRRKESKKSLKPYELVETVLSSEFFDNHPGLRRSAKKALEELDPGYDGDPYRFCIELVELMETDLSKNTLPRILDRLESFRVGTGRPVVSDMDVDILNSLGETESDLSLLLQVSGYNTFCVNYVNAHPDDETHVDEVYENLRSGLLSGDTEAVNSSIAEISQYAGKKAFQLSDLNGSLDYLEELGLLDRVPLAGELDALKQNVEEVRAKYGEDSDEFVEIDFKYQDRVYAYTALEQAGVSEKTRKKKVPELLLFRRSDEFNHFTEVVPKYGQSPIQAIAKLTSSFAPYSNALTSELRERIKDPGPGALDRLERVGSITQMVE